ncbi:DNA polymerase III subunit epsilon [Rhodobacterales bacterium LSUCC0387]|nr:DNA polymerase III subunit epsilon [Rhodobacterales bacterium LSUCC0387]
MREIVLDTETTGFEPSEGHRIVEIGAVELWNHLPTGKTYHQYINPERAMPQEAFNVHGLGDEFLADKPVFAAIAQDFLNFVGDAKLVIHNASFDMKFLNAELGWVNKPLLRIDQAIDTLIIARRKFPGSPASLDSLCRRFGVDNSMREKHGALLDSEILAEVYLELIGGKQPDFTLSPDNQDKDRDVVRPMRRASARLETLKPRLTDEEIAAHQEFISEMGDKAVWVH